MVDTEHNAPSQSCRFDPSPPHALLLLLTAAYILVRVAAQPREFPTTGDLIHGGKALGVAATVLHLTALRLPHQQARWVRSHLGWRRTNRQQRVLPLWSLRDRDLCFGTTVLCHECGASAVGPSLTCRQQGERETKDGTEAQGGGANGEHRAPQNDYR